MRRLPLRVLAILALFVHLIAIEASAYPTLTAHWGECPVGPVDPINAGPGDPRAETITITATGLSGLVMGVEVSLFFSTFGGGGIGNAWRFDPDGCEAGHLIVNQISGSSPCPLLTGPNPQTLSSTTYAVDSYQGTVTGRERFYAVQQFDPIVADPAKTYTIARFDFDRTNVFPGGDLRPDSCGCYERPMCIQILLADYLDGNGNTQDFAWSQGRLSWNDPWNSLSCGGEGGNSPNDTLCVANMPTPTRRASWGQVKVSYR
jgi:hypothetical protein